MKAHCAEYGFALKRHPEDDVTGYHLSVACISACVGVKDAKSHHVGRASAY